MDVLSILWLLSFKRLACYTEAFRQSTCCCSVTNGSMRLIVPFHVRCGHRHAYRHSNVVTFAAYIDFVVCHITRPPIICLDQLRSVIQVCKHFIFLLMAQCTCSHTVTWALFLTGFVRVSFRKEFQPDNHSMYTSASSGDIPKGNQSDGRWTSRTQEQSK